MKRIIPEFEFSEQQLNIIKSLAAECGLLPDTVKILYGRGFTDKESILKFLNPSRKHFISPFKMSGMDKAVELITRARDEKWSVVVFGDYDADGICASTIMYCVLKDFGIRAQVYVPERSDGYGLNVGAIDEIFEDCCPQLFITVDCGISCADEIEYIKEQGAEVIVTDHHELPDKIPDCVCVNPKFNDGYIYDNLCGAGVAFKVGVALNGESAYKYLDFAAIATVADSVPLTGENRDIVCEGLKIINTNPRKCYSHFLNKNENAVNSQTVAFGIAPKINAAGRMSDARAALKLFTSDDENVIFDYASKLIAYNAERQKYCDELYLSAKRKIKERGAYGRIIMLWDEEWNAGFVGIVAARLVEEYARPAILFVRNGDMLKGSARSVENVNIFEALKACDKHIAEFGGHAQAAGINIKVENFEKLEEDLNAYLSEHYKKDDFEHTVYVSDRPDNRYAARFAKELEMLEPFGVGNRRPVFGLELALSDAKPIKPLSPHLSFRSEGLEFLYFGGSRFLKLLQSRAPKKCVFEYNVSAFRGKEYVKGYVRSIIYDRNSLDFCGEEIDVNNILNAAQPRVKCNVEYASDFSAEDSGYGTVYIASDAKVPELYPELNNLPCELFCLSSGNLADTLLISPDAEADLSGFKRVIFLDEPLGGITNRSLEGKNITICKRGGVKTYAGFPCKREKLLKIFACIAADYGNLHGANSGEVALKNNLGFKPEHIAFALEVFRQLSLISFEDGKLTVYRGVKSELTNSGLYNAVCKLNGYRL